MAAISSGSGGRETAKIVLKRPTVHTPPVAAACGWAKGGSALPDDEMLRRLLALNRERAGQ